MKLHVVPALRLTWPGYLSSLKKVSGSMVDSAVSRPNAFLVYVTSIPIGSHRRCFGRVASAIRPMDISTRLHTAMACTVLMWFCTDHR